MYTNTITNLHKKVDNNYQGGGIISKDKNILNIYHTGLGNNLFEISNLLVWCWTHNYKYSIPDLNLLYQKIPEYPKDTIYRNLPTKYYDNMISINSGAKNCTYFHKYRNKLLSIFSIDPKSYQFLNQQYLSKFKNKILVSMHIRRGDFVFIAKTWNPNYIIKKEYYDKAYQLIKQKLNCNFELLIFSDDIPWCRQYLKYPNAHYINNIDYLDLWLMSLCNHNIICSSTFSWWGAYLNSNFGNNIVICPRKSVFKEKKNLDILNKEYYPSYWIILNEG